MAGVRLGAEEARSADLTLTPPTHFFVTGGAGFIGSNLVDRLLRDGDRVTAYDNFSTGFRDFLADAQQNQNFRLIEGDLLDPLRLTAAMAGADFVVHLAANADVRFGLEHPRKDLEQNTIATFNVLEAMRANSVGSIAFSSTGSIYGEASVVPTPEDSPFPVQTSLYGASKLACEGLIQAYAQGFGFRGWIFRFVSILGPRYTHGHVFDFYKALLNDQTTLRVLGNGQQTKSYLHITDCVEAILTALAKSDDKVSIFNLGTDERCKVTDSIGWITGHLGLNPGLAFTGGDRGWTGDNPLIALDCSRIRRLGWKPTLTIRESVVETVRYLESNRWVLERPS